MIMVLQDFKVVAHMGQTFKNGPSKTCGRQPLKNFTWSILEDLDLYTENI